MNWLAWTLKIVALIPSVVIGIEQITQGAKQGAAKKDLAMASLGLSSAVASQVEPEHQEAITAATNLASNAIDNTVTMLNAIQHPAFVPAPALASTPAQVSAAATVAAAVQADAPAQSGPGLHTAVPA